MENAMMIETLKKVSDMQVEARENREYMYAEEAYTKVIREMILIMNSFQLES